MYIHIPVQGSKSTGSLNSSVEVEVVVVVVVVLPPLRVPRGCAAMTTGLGLWLFLLVVLFCCCCCCC